MNAAPQVDGWKHVSSGKVRELYVPATTANVAGATELLLVASDRVRSSPLPGIGGSSEKS
jgi:hypothetical protein